MSEYPEHAKLDLIADKSQAIGEFLEWLEEGGLDNPAGDDDPWNADGRYGSVELAFRERYGPSGERWQSRDLTRSSDLTPIGIGRLDLLARYFEIDLDKIEAEKRAMICSLQRPEGLELPPGDAID